MHSLSTRKVDPTSTAQPASAEGSNGGEDSGDDEHDDKDETSMSMKMRLTTIDE